MIGVMEDKKIFEQLAYKIAREVAAEKDRLHGIILEDIQGKFQFLKEGQEAMEERMDRFDGRLARVEDKIDGMDARLIVVENRIDGIDVRLDKIDGRLDRIDVRMDRMDGKIDGIVTGITGKADKKEVVVLGHRITNLEHS
jgi:archaellum component FlaC